MPSLDEQLSKRDSGFWAALREQTLAAPSFTDLVRLSKMRQKAKRGQWAEPTPPKRKIKLALLGGYTLFPFHECLEQLLWATGIECELFIGEYSNYVSEILDRKSKLYAFRPELLFLWPRPFPCYLGDRLSETNDAIRKEIHQSVEELLDLCRQANEALGAEILLANTIPPAPLDPGPVRAKALGAEWTLHRTFNLELGLRAPAYVHICDLDLLAAREGRARVESQRAWLESKQACAFDFQIVIAREAAHLIRLRYGGSKKVLVVDADNTLWGGTIGDDGVDGIELGTTSPRGEAFQAFQSYCKSLRERGILLAMASKNDLPVVEAALRDHPEMVLRAGDFVGMKVNWRPKSDNIGELAKELKLGLDSFVFVDDNPAEIDLVKQFAPEVTSLLLPKDPAEFVGFLKDLRLFEAMEVTDEDTERTRHYHAESERQALKGTMADLPTYLKSLRMEAVVSPFTEADLPRIAQLINKSNQFNLTTKRRSLAELGQLMRDRSWEAFTLRLSDRFGDHGLVSVVICRQEASCLSIDTWLMSCRVLERQVEEEALNEIMRIAQSRSCRTVKGTYSPTAKNAMVSELYPRLGFKPTKQSPTELEFEMKRSDYLPRSTQIKLARPVVRKAS